ncbi:hypothetical protein HK096_000507 [Nowakowskiella sp. JEL0078]|nr:hypothetical protein HK096_000507 [Nowakowskiella sp. JEL0078]
MGANPSHFFDPNKSIPTIPSVYPKRIWNVVLKRSELVTEEIKESIAHEGYVVVSHVWGPWVRQIDIEGVPWPVPLQKLEKFFALTKYAKDRGYKWMWMDVLCIDQSNSNEKLEELPKMSSFYSDALCAILVVDCCTLSAEEQLFALFPKWPITIAEIPVKGELGAGISHEFGKLQAAAAHLFADEWFWRVWTYQKAFDYSECVLPKRFECICAHGEKSKKSLDEWLTAGHLLQATHSISYPGALPIENHWRTGREFTSISNLALIRQRLLEGSSLQLTPIIASLSTRESSLIDDRLFGILGLLAYGKYMKVEYGNTRLAWKQISCLAVEFEDFSILAFKEPPVSTHSSIIPGNDKNEVEGWSWFGPLMNQIPVYEYSHLYPLCSHINDQSSVSLLRESDVPFVPEIDMSTGRLKIECGIVGTISWVKEAAGLTVTDPADIMELISQFIFEGKVPKARVTAWLIDMLPTTATAAIEIAEYLVNYCISLGDSRSWNKKIYDDIETEYRRDGTEGQHGMWDLRNMVEYTITHYSNQWRAESIGRAAIITGEDESIHLVVLDHEVETGARVYAYAEIDRAEGRKGLMTFICTKSDTHSNSTISYQQVSARATPIHSAAGSKLRVVPVWLK